MIKQINTRQQKKLKVLHKKVKNLKTSWHAELGVMKKLSGTLDKAKSREKPENMVLRFASTNDELLGPNFSKSQLKISRSVPAITGGKRISCHLTIDNMVFLEGRIVGYVDDKRVLTKVLSSLPRTIAVNGKATLTEKGLLAILRERFMSHPDAEEYLKQVDSDKDTRKKIPFPMTSRPQLVIKLTDKGYRPVWNGLAILPVDVVMPARTSSYVLTQAEYYIDAVDSSWVKTEATIEFAEVSSAVSGYAVIRPDDVLQVVNTQGILEDGTTYFLKNIDKDIEIIIYDANANGANLANRLSGETMDISEDADGDWNDWTDSTDAATRSSSQQPEIDAMRFAKQIYEYYEAKGWKGFDNEGWDSCPVRIITHVGMTVDVTGAAFDKYTDSASGNKHGYLKFYDGKVDGGDLVYDFYAGELGTIAHEYQHAVTYFGVTKATGEPGGLYSDVIRGSFREGYSDSFAGLISGVWMLRAPWPTGVGIDGPPLRRIEFPRSIDTVNGTANCDHYDDIGLVNDKYYKSANLSFAAFLLGQGGIHERAIRSPQYIPIPPIDADKVAAIWLHTLTDKLDTLAAAGGDKRMVDVGNFLLESAEDLYGVNSKEYVLLRRTLYAAGLYPYDTTTSPYSKQSYGGEACLIPWGVSWRRSQQYLSLPMFYYYKSMDLFIDNGDGQEYDVNIGEENKIFARVRNIGDQSLDDISVEFWFKKCGSALPAEETGWNRCRNAAGIDCTLNIATLAAGDTFFDDVYNDSHAVFWYLDPAEITDEIDHFCLRAKIICDAPNHNNDYENYVQSNVQHVLVDTDSDAQTLIAFQVANRNRKKKFLWISRLNILSRQVR